MIYQRLTKQELIDKINSLEAELVGVKDTLEKEIKKNEKMQISYSILENARKEDSEKLISHEMFTKNVAVREIELINNFEAQKASMRNELNNQNEAMVNLFKMMDATINLQIVYYNGFKNIFVEDETKKDGGNT